MLGILMPSSSPVKIYISPTCKLGDDQKKGLFMRKKIKHIIELMINNSMATVLLIYNACMISVIYKSQIMYHQQFFFIILFLYLSFKMYEKYKRDTGSPNFSFLKKRNLGKIFVVLMIISLGISLFADILYLSSF